MSRTNSSSADTDFTSGELQRIGPLLARAHPELVVSKRRLRKVESIECVRLKRESARQNLGFSSRPFVLCGLPVKQPAQGCLLHERRNGQFVLQVTGHPSYGLPWGQDRRDAAGRFAVPALGGCFSKNLRSHYLFRHRHAKRAGGSYSSSSIQFHE